MRELVHPSEREEHLELKRLFDADRLEEIDFTDKLMDQIHKRDSFKTKRWSILEPLRTFKGIAFVVIMITLISSSAYATYEKSISLKDRNGNVLLNILPGSGDLSEGVDPAHSEIMNTYRDTLNPGESMSFIFGNKEEVLNNKKIRTYFVQSPFKISDLKSDPKVINSPLADHIFPGKKILRYTFDHALIFNALDKYYLTQTHSKEERINVFTFTVNENGVEYGYRRNPTQEDISSIQLKYVKGKDEITYSLSFSEPFASVSPYGGIMHVFGPMGSLHNINETEAYYSESNTDSFKSVIWMEKKNYRTYTHRISSFQASQKQLLAFAEEVVGK